MRLLLDACILYPTVLREILMAVAQTGAFLPLYSERILGEWQHVAERKSPETASTARVEIALFRAAFPQGCVAPADGAEDALSLPDPGDLHVLAAALGGGAEGLLTANIRDFPPRTLARHGIWARTPDSYLRELYDAMPSEITKIAEGARSRTEAASGRTQPLKPLLKRAGLPRLAKAVAAPADSD